MNALDHLSLNRSVAATYDELAPFYDRYVSHPHYPHWIQDLARLAAEYGASSGRVLDVGCGTGASLEPLIACGWSAVGCDISEAMLALARARLPQVAFHQADMRCLPALGRFELIWSVNDPINYLPTTDDIRAASSRPPQG